MRVDLITSTPNPELVVALAAARCTSTDWYFQEFGKLAETNPEKCSSLIRRVTGMGHTSVLEHVSFTFHITGISRSASHQLVRFRIASFSQQSQRYVNGPFDYVLPSSIEEKNLEGRFDNLVEDINSFYKFMLLNDVPAEDARFILPNAANTSLIMTMNARELLHAFSLRCCTHAQWEIRGMFNEILEIVKPLAPTIFEKAGASCVQTGRCPEGLRSCGKIGGTVECAEDDVAPQIG